MNARFTKVSFLLFHCSLAMLHGDGAELQALYERTYSSEVVLVCLRQILGKWQWQIKASSLEVTVEVTPGRIPNGTPWGKLGAEQAIAALLHLHICGTAAQICSGDLSHMP